MLKLFRTVRRDIGWKKGLIPRPLGSHLCPTRTADRCGLFSCAPCEARAINPDAIEAYSAGIEKPGLDPRAVEVMQVAGVDISGQASKQVGQLSTIEFDDVVSVCSAAEKQCPTMPSKTRMVHVPFDAPPKLAQQAASEAATLEHYRRVRDEIRRYVETLPAALEEGPLREM